MKIYLIEVYGGEYEDVWSYIKEAYINKESAIDAKEKYEKEYKHEREMYSKAYDMYNELMDKYIPDGIDYTQEDLDKAIEKTKNDMGDLYKYYDDIDIYFNDTNGFRIIEVELKDLK